MEETTKKLMCLVISKGYTMGDNEIEDLRKEYIKMFDELIKDNKEEYGESETYAFGVSLLQFKLEVLSQLVMIKKLQENKEDLLVIAELIDEVSTELKELANN